MLRQFTMSKETQRKSHTLIGQLRKEMYGHKRKGVHPVITACNHAGFRNAVYGWVYSNGETQMQLGDACHYGLTQLDQQGGHCRIFSHIGRKHAISIVNLIQPPGHDIDDKEEIREGVYGESQLLYYHWLLNESPWSPVFITKDAQEAIDWGIITSTRAPANLVGGSCVAIRHGWEKIGAYFLAQYFKLETDPVLRNIAYYFAQTLQAKSSGYTLFNPNSEGHYTLNNRAFLAESFVNFITGIPKFPKDSYYSYPAPFSCRGEIKYSMDNMWGTVKNGHGYTINVRRDMGRLTNRFKEKVEKEYIWTPKKFSVHTLQIAEMYPDKYKKDKTGDKYAYLATSIPMSATYKVADEMFRELAEEHNLKVA